MFEEPKSQIIFKVSAKIYSRKLLYIFNQALLSWDYAGCCYLSGSGMPKHALAWYAINTY